MKISHILMFLTKIILNITFFERRYSLTTPGAIISIFLKALYYLTCMDILAACVSAHHVYAVSGSRKRVSSPLEWEFQMRSWGLPGLKLQEL